MLNETLNQPYILIVFLILGVVGGFIFDIGNFIKFLFANRKIASILIDFIETVLCLFLIFYVNVKVNYGQLRFFPLAIFIFSFIIERFTIGKLIAKIYNMCYHLLEKINKKIWSKKKNAKANKND